MLERLVSIEFLVARERLEFPDPNIRVMALRRAIYKIEGIRTLNESYHSLSRRAWMGMITRYAGAGRSPWLPRNSEYSRARIR